MARNLDPKCKQCRRVGQKLFLKGDRCFSTKCAMIKRNYAPGPHGQKSNRRLSVYGKQLQAKQKLKKLYRILEKQLKNYYKKAIDKKGNTGETLIQYLEMRFDNVVYRAGYAESRDKARQLVNHGHFLINGKKVDIPSAQIRINDVVSVKESHRDHKNFKQAMQRMKKSKYVPEWMVVDAGALEAKIMRKPALADVKDGMDMSLIVEYYSK